MTAAIPEQRRLTANPPFLNVVIDYYLFSFFLPSWNLSTMLRLSFNLLAVSFQTYSTVFASGP